MNRIKQVTICVVSATKKLRVEVFIEFHQTSWTNANTMLKLVKDYFLTFGLPFSGIRGQGYDGASNMSVSENWLQGKVLPKILKPFTYNAFDINSTWLSKIP